MAKEKPPLESEVQKQIVSRFKKLGVPVWRRNVAMMMGEYKGKTRVVRSGKKGMSDLWFILNDARHGEFETKRPGNKPGLDQILWLRETNEMTGASFWADNADVAETVVKALMAGGRIVYMSGEKMYPNPNKKLKGRVPGPSYEYDIEMGT
jgi:hypothetical protein